MVVVIGAIATAIIAAVAGFLIVGGVATIVPQIQMFLLMLGLGVLAWLTKDVQFFNSGKWTLSGGVVFGAGAAALMGAMFFGVSLPQFSGSFVSFTGSIYPGSIAQGGLLEEAAASLQELGIEPMSLASIISVIGATFSIVMFADIAVFGGTLLKKGKTKIIGRAR